MTNLTRLDFSLETAQERIDQVNEALIAEQSGANEVSSARLEYLADYILDAPDTREKTKPKNRKKTISAHEISYEGLVTKFENGEDGLYNLTIENDKNIILAPKTPITQEDIDEIPALKELTDAIEQVKLKCKTATGTTAYNLHQQLIQMYKDRYVIRSAYKPIGYSTNYIKSISNISLAGTDAWDGTKVDSTSVISLYNRDHVLSLLNNYSKIKEDTYGAFSKDMHWLMEDLDTYIEEALAPFPLYKQILIYKIDKCTNAEIHKKLQEETGQTYSEEHISNVWCNIIPKLIIEKATDDYLSWYYLNKEKGKYKKCSKCGQIKLALPRYFSLNKGSKDGLYTICKECRRKRG